MSHEKNRDDGSNTPFSPSSPTPMYSPRGMSEEQEKEVPHSQPRVRTSMSGQSTAVATSVNGGPKARRGTRASTLSQLRERTQEIMKPARPIGIEPTTMQSIMAFLTSSCAFILVLFGACESITDYDCN